MTIMSGKGLNITGIHKREKPHGQTSNKQSEIEDHGRLDTQEDEFDVQTITKIHAQKQKPLNDSEKKATGMSVNIFDVSSYGEVRLNNLANKSNYNKAPVPNQSVSYVQLDDESMTFGDPLNKKKSLASGSLRNQVIPEENGDNTSQLTGNFDISQD